MCAIESILLHTCCAPCMIAPYYQLRDEGIGVAAFWYNPNIHPVTEYRLRRDALRQFCARESIMLVERDEYGLRDFVRAVADDIDGRCGYCYDIRLEEVAKFAAREGYEAFSTTLLYSRYQDHERIIRTAEQYARQYGVAFFYRDWRVLWNEGVILSRQQGMYRQKYCGCVFSEEDRYLPRKEVQ